LEQVDGGSDSDNLVNGNPKVDVDYEFRVLVKDPVGTPQSVKLFMTQRSNPYPNDFFAYTMNCTGDYSSGAICTYRTKLGPAKIHKFYIGTTFADGTSKTYPSSGYLTGPNVQLLNGFNLVGVPRDINSSNLDGMSSFGSRSTYELDPSLGSYKLVTSANPVQAGQGYFSYKSASTLLELGNFRDVQGPDYKFPLSPGWNIISNPFGGNVRLSDVKMQQGNTLPVSWQTATANGWLLNAIYFYNGSDWGDTYSWDTDTTGVLVPWLGYLVYLNNTDTSYSLIISKP
jgi:hypothetical protein